MQEFRTSTRSEGRAKASLAACTWMNVQGIIAVLDDAARGLVNDVASLGASRLMSIGSPRWRSLEWLDPEEMGHSMCVSTFSLLRAVSFPILSSIRVIPRLPAGDRRIRCVRISPWLVPNNVGILRFYEARQMWFRRTKFTNLSRPGRSPAPAVPRRTAR
jgi:hypothetical protein